MQSPFALFRKHARVLTVVLTGLAMFAFIILPQLEQMPNQTEMFGMLMAGLLLGTAFWILGRPSGHATEYGIGGLLLGVILMGFVVPRFAKPNAAVQLSIGSLSKQDVNNQMRKMQTANAFVGRIRAQVDANQQQQGQRFLFGNTAEENAAMVSILNHEADEMGIRLSDDAITEFIKRETGGQLTSEQFKEVRMNLRLSETELYDILRGLLRAELAYTMLMPRVPTTPAEFWEYYRRLNVKQEIEVAAIPVEEFESDKDPSDADIAAFFDKYKDKIPTDNLSPLFMTPEPGFLQPRKIKIAYLEVDYNTVRAELEQTADFAVSDDEIKEYYEKNKDLLYVKRPALEEQPPFEEAKSPDVDKPLDPVIAPEPKSNPESEPPEKKPQPKPDKPSPDKPSPDKPSPDKPKTPAPKKEPEAEKPDETSPDNGGQFSVEDPVEEKPDATDAAADSNADETTADTPAAATDDSPVEAPVPGEKAKEEPPPVEYQPLDDDLKAEIREALLTDRLDAATDEKVASIRRRAASFINDLRNEVIDDFNRQDEPTAEEQAERAKTIAGKAGEYAKQQGLKYAELELFGAEELSKRGETAAELWNTLQGTEEKPSTEDQDVLDYLIAQATEARMKDDNRRSEPRSVLQILFGTDSDRLFNRKEGQDPISSNQYVYWTVADRPSEVPELSDPGIRDQVVAALKTANARKPAEARAKALAEKTRSAIKGKDDETLKEMGNVLKSVLDGEKVNPQDSESVELSFRDTGESFSWLTVSTARSPSPFTPERPMLSEPTSVEKAGNDFMRAIFDELDEGDVGIAPNADKTTYYVVRVKNRVESPPTGSSDFREAYLKQEFFPQKFELGGRELGPFPTTYTFLTRAEAGTTVNRWRQQLLEKYEYRRAVP